MISDPLSRKSHEFAQEIQKLLNSTLTQNVRINSAEFPFGQGRLFMVAAGLSRSRLFRTSRFPLRTARGRPEIWMEISFQLHMDLEGEYLTVYKSFVGVFRDETTKVGLVHFDYERDKTDGYPDAHLQVQGYSEFLAELLPDRPLAKLHFPVGGKRFRPCLEDVIEFLIVEDLAQGASGWREALKPGRERFQRKQLRAAMRRNPDIVREFMTDYPLDEA
ncbi:hypothetical protein ADK56_02900 [Streptomyces sp. MMG1522]|nr:hypothetical protein ADK56_02900 [Streptomyces sp. MMG1522]